MCEATTTKYVSKATKKEHDKKYQLCLFVTDTNFCKVRIVPSKLNIMHIKIFRITEMNTFLDDGIFKTYNRLKNCFVSIYVHIWNANFKMHKPHNPM